MLFCDLFEFNHKLRIVFHYNLYANSDFELSFVRMINGDVSTKTT